MLQKSYPLVGLIGARILAGAKVRTVFPILIILGFLRIEFVGSAADSLSVAIEKTRTLAQSPITKFSSEEEKRLKFQAIANLASFERLRSNENEALEVLSTCNRECREILGSVQWEKSVRWHCSRKKNTKYQSLCTNEINSTH